MGEKITSLEWEGVSGKSYTFNLYELGTKFKVLEGLYIFARISDDGDYWEPLYIGETDSFQRRLSLELEAHHCLERVRKNGGGEYIFVCQYSGGKAARCEAEKDLRDNYDPPCNRQ